MLTTVLFTFLGEKLSAVLPSSDHFAWDLPKELHDQSDVVCPPPHTSQREQAWFSITACTHTHTSTQPDVWDWNTLLSCSSSMDTHSDGWLLARLEGWSHTANRFPSFKFLHCSDWLLVSMFLCFRQLCIPVPPALRTALPLLLKNSREYFPESAKCLGIQPSSSMMWAMWSIEGGGKGIRMYIGGRKVDAREIKWRFKWKRRMGES